VISVAAERLSLGEAGLDRDARTLRLRETGLETLLYFEWGDELRWRKLKMGRSASALPGPTGR